MGVETIATILAGFVAPFFVGLLRAPEMEDGKGVLLAVVASVFLAVVAKFAAAALTGTPLTMSYEFFYANSVGVLALSQLTFNVLKEKVPGALGRETGKR